MDGAPKTRDFGLLFLRVGLGAMFVGHGAPKLLGGPAMWEKIGKAMANLGIDFMPTAWGLLAALAEFGGGILIAAGVLYLPACLAMFFTMVVACVTHISNGDGFGTTSHAAEAGIAFLAMALIGPGPWRIKLSR